MRYEAVPPTFISEVEIVWLPSASNMSNTSRAFRRRDLSARLSVVSCCCKILYSKKNMFSLSSAMPLRAGAPS